MPEPIGLDAEDAKIVTLARSAQARTGAQEGAAVRDTDGRTYTGATVSLPSLTLTALQAAVASGARSLEVAAVVSGTVVAGPNSVDAASLAALHELGPTALVLVADHCGTVRDVLRGAR